MTLKLKEVIPKFRYLKLLVEIQVWHEVTKFLESLGKIIDTLKISNRSVRTKVGISIHFNDLRSEQLHPLRIFSCQNERLDVKRTKYFYFNKF